MAKKFGKFIRLLDFENDLSVAFSLPPRDHTREGDEHEMIKSESIILFARNTKKNLKRKQQHQLNRRTANENQNEQYNTYHRISFFPATV